MCPRPGEFAHVFRKMLMPGGQPGEAWAPLELSDALLRRGGQIFEIVASRFVDVSEEEINLMKEKCHSEEYQTRYKVRNDTCTLQR